MDHSRTIRSKTIILFYRSALIAIMIMGSLSVVASNVIAHSAINMHALALTESDGREDAISCAGARHGRGLYQISEIMLKDYNMLNKCDIKPDQLFDVQINEKVAKWAIEKRITQLLRHYKQEVTTESILQAFNLGAKAYSMGKRNNKYISRYIKKGGTL